MTHHDADRSHPGHRTGNPRRSRPVAGRHRPLRSQRGVCPGTDGVGSALRGRSRPTQSARRRNRVGSSARSSGARLLTTMLYALESTGGRSGCRPCARPAEWPTPQSSNGCESRERKWRMQIEGITAVVTGGASGLGRATVERLVKSGAAKVIIADLLSSDGETVAEGPGRHRASSSPPTSAALKTCRGDECRR